ncbi:MAG: hypothetical protein ACRCS3_13135 [Paracoccaceae bacterium]
MGREVQAQVRFLGQTGLVRALLESDALILRGEVRLRLPRTGLHGWRADGDDLHLNTPSGPLTLTMGPQEAGKWVQALNKPLPSLPQKLGLADAVVWPLTPIDDPVLVAALLGANCNTGPQATLGIAIVCSTGDLDTVLATHAAHPDLPIWVANLKGPKAAMPESDIRTALRAAGMVDTKACAISAALSGTRYQRRRG